MLLRVKSTRKTRAGLNPGNLRKRHVARVCSSLLLSQECLRNRDCCVPEAEKLRVWLGDEDYTIVRGC